MKKIYLSKSENRKWAINNPIGDPFGGPAYGEKNEPTTIMMAIGSAISAVSQISQAQQAKNAANYNAQIAEQQATAARQTASANADRQRRSAERQLGSMQAGYSASGVSSSEGSALDILSQSARDAELDYQTILHGGEMQARGYQNTANLERSRASNAMSSGYMSAAGTLIGGAGKAYGGLTSSGGGAYGPTPDGGNIYRVN
jgi:hypothetical protein